MERTGEEITFFNPDRPVENGTVHVLPGDNEEGESRCGECGGPRGRCGCG